MNLKIVGAIVSIAGAGLGLVANWVDEKQMEEAIDQKVSEALAKKEAEEV